MEKRIIQKEAKAQLIELGAATVETRGPFAKNPDSPQGQQKDPNGVLAD